MAGNLCPSSLCQHQSTGLDYDNTITFRIDLNFSDGLTDQELKEARDLYAIGNLIRVNENFFVSSLDDYKWMIIITDPVASHLPKVVVTSLEESMEATYLPQKTLESMYELPGNLRFDEECHLT